MYYNNEHLVDSYFISNDDTDDSGVSGDINNHFKPVSSQELQIKTQYILECHNLTK